MSQENVETVRRLYDAFARRDNEVPFEIYAPDIIWDVSRAMPEGVGGLYRGHEAVREHFQDLLGSFASIAFELKEITEVGDCVLVGVHERYLGRASGAEVDRRHYALLRLRDGKVTQMVVYLDRADALGAVSSSA